MTERGPYISHSWEEDWKQLRLFPLPPRTYRMGYVKNAWTKWIVWDELLRSGLATTRLGQVVLTAHSSSAASACQEQPAEDLGKTGWTGAQPACQTGTLVHNSEHPTVTPGRVWTVVEPSGTDTSTETGDRGLIYLLRTLATRLVKSLKWRS